MTVRVVGAGLQSTIQDLGRPTHQHEGIPACGAMDRSALRVGNLLVGNDQGAAGIEATLIGPTLVFDSAALIAITGGNLDPTIDGAAVRCWRPLSVPAGATLRFGRAMSGCRAYVSIAGGIDVPTVFGSRSTYIRGGFGGLDGRALRAGDALSLGQQSPLSQTINQSIRRTEPDASRVATATWSAGFSLRPSHAEEPTARLIPGAHTELLSNESRAALVSSAFRISSSSDRMGYRLEGPTLALRTPVELLSEAVTFGTIQLPPGGAAIVLMADRATTGGYPRIGEVASVDLPLIAQLKPGDRVRFRTVSLADAHRLYLAHEQELDELRAGIAVRAARGTF